MWVTGFEPAQALSHSLSNMKCLKFGKPGFPCLKGYSFDHSDTPT